jgi:hypothetical protein
MDGMTYVLVAQKSNNFDALAEVRGWLTWSSPRDYRFRYRSHKLLLTTLNFLSTREGDTRSISLYNAYIAHTSAKQLSLSFVQRERSSLSSIQRKRCRRCIASQSR